MLTLQVRLEHSNLSQCVLLLGAMMNADASFAPQVRFCAYVRAVISPVPLRCCRGFTDGVSNGYQVYRQPPTSVERLKSRNVPQGLHRRSDLEQSLQFLGAFVVYGSEQLLGLCFFGKVRLQLQRDIRVAGAGSRCREICFSLWQFCWSV